MPYARTFHEVFFTYENVFFDFSSFESANVVGTNLEIALEIAPIERKMGFE